MRFPPDGHPYYPPPYTSALDQSPVWFWLWLVLIALIALVVLA